MNTSSGVPDLRKTEKELKDLNNSLSHLNKNIEKLDKNTGFYNRLIVLLTIILLFVASFQVVLFIETSELLVWQKIFYFIAFFVMVFIMMRELKTITKDK